MITIHGVNKRQIKLLDKMWEIDSFEDYNFWKESLNAEAKREVGLLEELVLLADIDNMVEEDVSDANDVLSKFM